MVPIVTGLLILIAIALIATFGLPSTLKPQPIRQLTMEHFATTLDIPEVDAMYAEQAKFLYDNEFLTIYGPLLENLLIKYITSVSGYNANKILNDIWEQVFLKLEPKFNTAYPNSATPLKQFFTDFMNQIANEIVVETDPNTIAKAEELRTAIQNWIPTLPQSSTTTVTGATTTSSTPATANLFTINVTQEAINRVSTVMGFIDKVKFEELVRQYKITDMTPTYFLNAAWRIFYAALPKYDTQYPKTTTTLAQVFVAALLPTIREIMDNTNLKAGRGEPLLLALKTWLPPQPSSKTAYTATPYSNLASKPATVGMNNFGGNQFSLATITVPISTSDSILKDLTGTSATIATPNAQAVPVNMISAAGPAPALNGSEMDAIINKLVKDTLKVELANIGKADKVAITSKSTPGLSQGSDFKDSKEKTKGTPPNPNCASANNAYNHLGPMADYQDNFHPPLMPDGGFYDPRLYVRKDSIPCQSCSLDY